MKATPVRRPPEEVLAFMLGKQEFGIDMLKVQEVCGFDAFAQDAGEIDLEKGVVSLRGECIPIIDMRLRFALGEPVYDESTSVIVLDVGGHTLMLVVDGISDVHRMDAAQMQPVPRKRGALGAEYLLGLGAFGQHRIILIAADKLMTVIGAA
ncbi:MAG TPA: chemotaxis protein CheW [Noviherbaspirillum sp.]